MSRLCSQPALRAIFAFCAFGIDSAPRRSPALALAGARVRHRNDLCAKPCQFHRASTSTNVRCTQPMSDDPRLNPLLVLPFSVDMYATRRCSKSLARLAKPQTGAQVRKPRFSQQAVFARHGHDTLSAALVQEAAGRQCAQTTVNWRARRRRPGTLNRQTNRDKTGGALGQRSADRT